MQYRDKIIELIRSDNNEEFINWVQQQPLIEQPDIMREFKQIMTELLENAGITEELKDLEDFDKKADAYEESILDEQLASLKLDIAKSDLDKQMEEVFTVVEGMREYVIECIVTNADNAAEMRELAQHIIHFEKESGTYDPKNWEAIL